MDDDRDLTPDQREAIQFTKRIYQLSAESRLAIAAVLMQLETLERRLTGLEIDALGSSKQPSRG